MMQTLTLADPKSDTRLEVVPDRGLITRWVVNGRDVLYLDRATVEDRTKSLRGGIPVLFPIAGELQGDRYEVDGVAYTMKKHGFARDRAWTVQSQGDSHVTLSLEDDVASRAQFPFAFRVSMAIEIDGSRLDVVSTVTNRGDREMPCALGFHPYFLVPDGEKKLARIEVRGSRAFDNVTKLVVPFNGFDLTLPELDLHLLDPQPPAPRLVRADRSSIGLATSAQFTTVVGWTVAGKDYVCLEPWTAPGNALNSGENLHRIAPGAESIWHFTLTVTD